MGDQKQLGKGQSLSGKPTFKSLAYQLTLDKSVNLLLHLESGNNCPSLTGPPDESVAGRGLKLLQILLRGQPSARPSRVTHTAVLSAGRCRAQGTSAAAQHPSELRARAFFIPAGAESCRLCVELVHIKQHPWGPIRTKGRPAQWRAGGLSRTQGVSGGAGPCRRAVR